MFVGHSAQEQGYGPGRGRGPGGWRGFRLNRIRSWEYSVGLGFEAGGPAGRKRTARGFEGSKGSGRKGRRGISVARDREEARFGGRAEAVSRGAVATAAARLLSRFMLFAFVSRAVSLIFSSFWLSLSRLSRSLLSPPRYLSPVSIPFIFVPK